MPNKIFYKLSSTQFPISGNKTYDDSNLVDSLIQWEGFLDHPTNIGDNKITLGSGLTDPKWIKLYKKKGNKWSAEDNRAAVAEEVASRRKWAEKNVPNWNKLPFESQQAMLSYKYNYNFTPENSPNMYTALRAFDLPEVARQMDATSDDPKFKKGLQERREREQAWFMEGVEKREKVNSPSFLTNLMDKANHRLEAAQKKAQAISTINDMKDKVKSWPFSKKAEGGSLRSSWDDLSLVEKSEMMKVAIKNGITDLSTIRQKYNEFAEGGDISDEEYYTTMEKVAEENNPIWNKQRIAEGGRPLSVEEDLIRILNDNSYDYKGFYNKYPPTAANANSHWTDEFKTAYHPTFSDQSKYSGKKSQYNPYGYRGGHWVGDTFFPEIWQAADSNKFDIGGPLVEVANTSMWYL